MGFAVALGLLWGGYSAAAAYDTYLPAGDARDPRALPAPATPTPATPTPAAPIPDGFAGAWTGTIQDRGEATIWTAKFVLPEGKSNGKVVYVGGECRGTAVPISFEDGALTLDTHFSSGASLTCAPAETVPAADAPPSWNRPATDRVHREVRPAEYSPGPGH